MLRVHPPMQGWPLFGRVVEGHPRRLCGGHNDMLLGATQGSTIALPAHSKNTSSSYSLLTGRHQDVRAIMEAGLGCLVGAA